VFNAERTCSLLDIEWSRELFHSKANSPQSRGLQPAPHFTSGGRAKAGAYYPNRNACVNRLKIHREIRNGSITHSHPGFPANRVQLFFLFEDTMHTGQISKLIQRTSFVLTFCAGLTMLAGAQVREVGALSRTDVALSFYGAFSGTTNGGNVQQSPSNSAGGLVEVRHIANPLLGFEGTYSFNRDNQTYTSTINCGLPCEITPTTVKADAHEVTADYIASLKVLNLCPFALAGGGLLFDQPTGGQASTMSATKGVFVYGAGLDWSLLPHIGLRLQYRGNLYRAPDLTTAFGSTNAFVHTSEPAVGAFFRF
jgi:opacity protein-like surface antigen